MPIDLRYCRQCLYSEMKPDIWFDPISGVCSACIAYEDRQRLNWEAREVEFARLSGRACIVPVSGGKDSTVQVLTALKYGLRPTAVTAITDSLSPLGRRNLDNISKLGVPHIEVKVDPKVRRRINKFTLTEIGDISWAEHVTIFSIPVSIAVSLGCSLILWGENSQNEYGGPATAAVNQRMTRSWLEEFGGLNGLRVSDVRDMLGLTLYDMHWYTYPTERREAQVTGLFLGHFFPWDGAQNAIIAGQNGFEWHTDMVEGSLCSWENLDNYQTGIHDWFKYLKYGFGRATDIASSAIRRGKLSRAEAIEAVREHDGAYPWTYLGRPLESILAEIDMTFDEFNVSARRFTNKRLFSIGVGVQPIPLFEVK